MQCSHSPVTQDSLVAYTNLCNTLFAAHETLFLHLRFFLLRNAAISTLFRNSIRQLPPYLVLSVLSIGFLDLPTLLSLPVTESRHQHVFL